MRIPRISNKPITDDLLHILWGLWIAVCFVYLPLVVAVVLAILPRELEQTYHALDDKSIEGLKAHISRKPYWTGKIRDLAGFAVGAAILKSQM